MRIPKKKKRLSAGYLFLAVLLVLGMVYLLVGWQRGTSRLNAASKPGIQPDRLYSASAVLVRLGDGGVLYQKEADRAVYPASLTKMMTVLTAVESLDSLDGETVLGQKLFDRLLEQDASVAGFQPQEQVRLRDLLYGAILPSGAECCLGLAEAAAGSEKQLVKKMNARAKQLGMKHTHFSNVTGLHEASHYTTAGDLARLLQYALTNETFRQVFTAKEHLSAPTNLHPDGLRVRSTLFQYTDGALENGRILGGKTGYTKEAGLCLASVAEVEGEEYILITTGADGGHDTEQFQILDAKLLYNSLN